MVGGRIVRDPSPSYLMDDALMFVRYADNLLAGHGMAWNPGEGSVYGATSLAYVFVVAAFRLVISDPAVCVLASGLACWTAFLAVAWSLIRKLSGGGLAASVVLACSAPGIHTLGLNMLTGMDTGLTVLWAAIWLHAFRADEESEHPAAPWLAGVAWLVRPELGVLCVGAHLLARRRGWGISVCCLAGVLAGCWLFLGSPLPLPFWAKSVSTGISGEPAIGVYRLLAGDALYDYLLVGFGLVFLGSWSRVWQSAKTRPLVVLWAGLSLYVLAGVAPIMGNYGRFYMILLPFLVGAAALGAREATLTQEGAWKRASLALALFGAALPVWVGLMGLRAGLGKWRPEMLGLQADLRSTGRRFWPAIEEAALMKDLPSVASTELGRPAVLFPRVLDLVGLNNPRRALQGSTALQETLNEKPDVVWLPLDTYQDTLNAFLASEKFRLQYRVWTTKELGRELGIGLKRGSPAEEALAPVVEKIARDQLAP